MTTYEQVLWLLAFCATVVIAAPVYFFWFWRWFDFWRARPVLTYTLICLTFAAIGVLVFLSRRYVFAPRFDIPHWLQAIGWFSIVYSCILGFVADRQIGFRVRSFAPHFEPRGRIKLQTTGAYAIVRHPIYSAGLFFLLGTFLATGYLAVLVSSLVLWLGSLWFTRREEERTMALLEDPAEYERYRKRVGALFPRFRRRA